MLFKCIHVNAGLSLGKDDEGTARAILEGGRSGTQF